MAGGDHWGGAKAFESGGPLTKAGRANRGKQRQGNSLQRRG